MVNRIKTPKVINFNIKCKDYLVKIIDFEWANKTPNFRTSEYHQKYFNKNKIKSELLLTIFFYCQTLKKDKNIILLILRKYSHIVEKYLESKNKLNNYELTNYEFDNLLLNHFERIIKPLI